MEEKEKGRTTGPAFSHNAALENEAQQQRDEITSECALHQSPVLGTPCQVLEPSCSLEKAFLQSRKTVASALGPFLIIGA
jgi:hypothetical protein